MIGSIDREIEKLHNTNAENYRQYIFDLEERSKYRKEHNLKLDSKLNSIMFLMPVTEYGYNFGQFRIASHLRNLGVCDEDIHFFPLHLGKGEYEFDRTNLKEYISKVQPKYIGVIAYLGWEYQLKEVIEYTRECTDATILMGGSLTSSHPDFAVNSMHADVIFIGHGEFLVEEYLFSAEEQHNKFPELNIDSIIYENNKVSDLKPYQNRDISSLNWDVNLLGQLCNITPIINLFTSDVCYGNCIFCYRTECMKESFVSREKLMEHLNSIVTNPKLNNERIKYLRFLDDDFFAAKDRDLDCLWEIYNIIKGHYKLYELQFSLRSIRKFNPKELVDIIQKMEIYRVTIGVDGYNDEDLHFLRKGYNMNEVFDKIEILSPHVNCMLYAILTTPITNIERLNDTFINMLKLVLMENVYIGPTINTVISLHSNNFKLYPNYKDDKFCYLNATDVSSVLDNDKNPNEVIMQADLLPEDRVTRKYIEKLGKVTAMDSAYIIPLVGSFYEFLAEEFNWLKRLLDSEFNALELRKLEQEREKVSDEICKVKEEKKDNFDISKTIEHINNLNSLQRQYHDINDKILLAEKKEKIVDRIILIENIIKKYVKFYNCYFNPENARCLLPQLHTSVNRMLPLPIVMFDSILKDKDDFSGFYENIRNQEFVISEDEAELFWR